MRETDAKRTKNSSIKSGYEVFSHGGRRPTGLDAIKWAKKAVKYGAGELLITSMDRDGTKRGFDFDLIKKEGLTSRYSIERTLRN